MKNYLGIELGSTRIKAVLIDESAAVKAIGTYTWENELNNSYWSYSAENIDKGLKECIKNLSDNADGITISRMGISAMMHGYIALDKDGKMLTPFRTWRNTNTGCAAKALSEVFDFNIPLRWSIAHLYQAILDGEPHVKDIAYLTTLSGYIHYRLTGEKVLGIGDASGMFPIDSSICDYNGSMLDKFDELIADKNYPWKIRDILPRVMTAGGDAGCLTENGAQYLCGAVRIGTPLCPPEGDAGTGMVATDSIKPLTGNVSAGTSLFAMIVLDKALKERNADIDMVTTPDGLPVAMVHCNNCTSDLNAWVGMLGEFADLLGRHTDNSQLMQMLFNASVGADCTGLMNYNYLSGEPIMRVENGRPIFIREVDSKLTLGGFFKAQIYSCLAPLAVGIKALEDEGVYIKEICGHGGFFKTEKVGQLAMSAAIGAPVTVMDNAGEGGAWGIAVLAAFADKNCSLPNFLDSIFESADRSTLCADSAQMREFEDFLQRYRDNAFVNL